MDLRGKATIADHGLAQADQGMGYDHNWCLRPTVGTDGLRLVATVHEPTSGRVMVVRTTEPGALVDQLLHSHSAPT
jgi:aldose 1-epimerase